MSRTYRKSWLNDWCFNLEAFETRESRWRFSESRDTNTGGQYTGMSIETTREYFEHFRDGWSETGRSSGFKEESQRNIRSKNRECISKLMKDVDAFDDMNFPDKYTEKYLIWSYW